MKIEMDKLILASTVLWLVFTLVFVYQLISTEPLDENGINIASPSLLIPLVLFWIFGVIAIILSLYDILTSKNGTKWKLGWVAAVFILNFIGVLAYLFIGRKSMKK